MKAIILFAALTLSVNLAMAEGGKVQEESRLFSEDGDEIGLLLPLPPNCELVGPSHSGKFLYFDCEGIDEDESDD